jgi:hypothetical protein
MNDFYFAKGSAAERAERSELFDSVVGQLDIFLNNEAV